MWTAWFFARSCVGCGSWAFSLGVCGSGGAQCCAAQRRVVLPVDEAVHARARVWCGGHRSAPVLRAGPTVCVLVYCVRVYRSDGRWQGRLSQQRTDLDLGVVCLVYWGVSGASAHPSSGSGCEDPRASVCPVSSCGLCCVLLSRGSDVEVVLRCVPVGCVAEALLLLRTTLHGGCCSQWQTSTTAGACLLGRPRSRTAGGGARRALSWGAARVVCAFAGFSFIVVCCGPKGFAGRHWLLYGWAACSAGLWCVAAGCCPCAAALQLETAVASIALCIAFCGLSMLGADVIASICVPVFGAQRGCFPTPVCVCVCQPTGGLGLSSATKTLQKKGLAEVLLGASHQHPAFPGAACTFFLLCCSSLQPYLG